MQSAATPLRFAVVFLLSFSLLLGAFEATRGTAFEKFLVEDLILRPTTTLINTLTPDEHVQLQGRTLASIGARLHVIRGCEGVEMFLMLAAGILAYPARGRRLQGLLLGSLLAYGLSVLRLMALYYTLSHRPSAWEALHGLILPLAPVVLMALFFAWWLSSGSSAAGKATVRAA